MLEDLRVYASKNQGKENDTVDALIEKRHFDKNVMILGLTEGVFVYFADSLQKLSYQH